jgi:hypothetical protein
MRSIVLACVFAAPLCAVAATPNYTSPLATVHQAKPKPKPQMAFLAFVNFTTQEREVRIGDMQYRIPHTTVLHMWVPVGTVVREYSAENQKVNGQELIEVAITDSGKSIMLP